MEQIYDSRHSGREVDNVVDAVQTTIPNQLTQIGLKIGDLTELETTDKTDLVSAINEIKEATEDLSGDAADISYTDNQGLGSTNVQGALDEVAERSSGIPVECYDHSHAVVSSSNASMVAEKTATGFTVACTETGAYRYAYCTIPDLEIGTEYKVTFDYVLAVESTRSLPYNLTIRTETGITTTQLANVVLQNLGMSGTASMTIAPTTNTTVFRIAANDMGAGTEMEISNISVIRTDSLKDTVVQSKSDIEALKETDIDYLSTFGYVAEKEATGFSKFSDAGCTNTGIITATIDTENSQILFDAVGAKTVKRYAWVKMPKLAEGQQYTMRLKYSAQIDGDGFVGVSTTTDSGGNIGGFNAATGTDVEVSFNYTERYGDLYFKTASNAVGGEGCYVHISDIKIYASGNTDYYTLPQLSKRMDDLEPLLTDATFTGYYTGERIPRIEPKHQIGYKKLFNNSACQGGSAYGNYWVEFSNHHTECRVYDIPTGTLLATLSMTAVSYDHCNNVCFSDTFYAEGDVFPLIYTSGSQTGTYNHVQVWRLQLVEGTYSIEQVQEIALPEGSESNPMWYWGQAYLDNELGYMWYAPHVNNVYTFFKFSIPAIFDGDGNVISAVTLTEEDSIDRFTAQKGYNQQGGAVHNGILYLLDGVPSWGTLSKLIVIDLRKKVFVTMVDIYHILGITFEYEGAGIYNNTLLASTNGKGVYAIYF